MAVDVSASEVQACKPSLSISVRHSLYFEKRGKVAAVINAGRHEVRSVLVSRLFSHCAQKYSLKHYIILKTPTE
jgi:hypothetical protein